MPPRSGERAQRGIQRLRVGGVSSSSSRIVVEEKQSMVVLVVLFEKEGTGTACGRNLALPHV